MLSSSAKKGENIAPFIRLHRALCVLLKKNRFIRKLTHTELSRSEIHVLIENQASPNQTVSRLQKMLCMDQSSVSRLIQSLNKRKIIKVKQGEKDKRSKTIINTSLGESLIKQIDEVAGTSMSNFSKRLNLQQREKLCRLFKTIADWHKQPEVPRRQNEEELRMQQRRMSRALGVLSQNLVGSGLSSSQWHTFFEICTLKYPPNPKQLSHSLSLPANSLSIILDKLELNGLIKRKSSSHDSRYIEVHPTKKGLNFLEQVETRCASEMEQMYSGYDQSEISELADILENYTGKKNLNVLHELPGGFFINEIDSEKGRNSARAFVVKEIVERGHADHTPSHLITDKSNVYGLFNADKSLMSICELEINSEIANLNVLAWKKEISPGMACAFISRIGELINISDEVKKIEYNFEPARNLLSSINLIN